MSFDQFRYASTQRDQDKVAVYLMASQPVPETVPLELQDSVTQGQWNNRLNEIKRLAFQFYKPLFERIWIVASFLVLLVVPMALYNIIFKVLTKNSDSNDRVQNARAFYNARSISFAIFLGLVALFWLPILAWKALGRRRMTVLLNRWAFNDEKLRGASTFIPRWTVQMPSVFRSTAVVHVTIPPGSRPSVFHHDAYIPGFVNAPRDQAVGAYYYPYGPGQVGVPRMSVVGNFNNDSNNGLPAYSGPGDYKGGYGDGKL